MDSAQPPRWTMAILSIGLIALIGILFTASVRQPTPTPTPIPTLIQNQKPVVLTLPEKIDIAPKIKTTLNLVINTGGEEISAAELSFSFDPNIIRVDSVAPLEFFPDAKVLQRTIDNKKGKVVFAIGGLPARSGSGQIAQISLTALKAGQTTLDLKNSKVAAVGNETNVLGKTTSTIITVEK